MIPTKEQIIQGQWWGWYTHFSERLKERYGLEIDFDEYKALCKSEREVIKSPTQNKQIVTVFFKGKKITAMRSRRYKVLSTALPHKIKR